MSKIDNSNLLNSSSAVEDYLDTLLQESTEQPEDSQPVRLKSTLLLMPDLEVRPCIPEIPEIQPEPELAITVIEDDIIIAELQQNKQPDSVEVPINVRYQFPLQCLMFSVAGNLLSIPIIDMGSVLAWEDRLTMLPGAPDWFLGILQHRDMNVKVVDTARIVNIKQNLKSEPTTKHIMVFGEDNWAITCDSLAEVIKLDENDVKWSKQSHSGLSLGTIKQSLATLLSPDKILNQLNKHDDMSHRII